MIAGVLQRCSWQLRQMPASLVVVTMIGLGLLVASAAGQRWVLAPMAKAMAEIREETNTLRSQAANRLRSEAGLDPVAQLGEFYDFFPPEKSLVETLDRIYAAAANQNLLLEHGEYRLVPESGARLQRYDVVLPVRGRYGAIRGFVAEVLKDNSNVALTAINFSRQAAIDSGVDAQLQLTLFLAAAP
jgi:hypothetical protein